MKDDVIWAVSDIHLGGIGSNHRDFADFLDWAAGKEGFTVQGSGRAVPRPTKLILLGDFLELWNPIGNDYKTVAIHVAESIKGLSKLADEVIFVTGNHDEALESYGGVYPIEDPRFRIVPRLHRSKDYEPSKDPRYIQVGDKRYFFIHGHEFDKLFLFLGPLSRIPTLMASLNDALRRVVPLEGWALPLSLVIFAVFSAFISIPPWALYILSLLSVPRLFTYLQGPFWKRFGRFFIDKPRYKDIAALVEKRYYDPKKDTIAADFVVYGHTHVPEVSSPEISTQLGKTFINTGSWVKDERHNKKNTLVVIDKEGPLLLHWNRDKKTFQKI